MGSLLRDFFLCSPFHHTAGISYSLGDFGVAGTATEVTGQSYLDLFVGGVGIFVEKGDGRHDQTGRTEAAL